MPKPADCSVTGLRPRYVLTTHPPCQAGPALGSQRARVRGVAVRLMPLGDLLDLARACNRSQSLPAPMMRSMIVAMLSRVDEYSQPHAAKPVATPAP
jgi:hypothetical protein